jgi:UDP-N-acetylglucosamine 3-dehydrogenase
MEELIVNIGILGSGRMGERHANAYKKIKNVKLIGFSDIDSSKAKNLAKQFDVKDFSPNEMISNNLIDAIDICLPNNNHFENTILSLKSGKHVLVEKPMALTLSDCDKMISEAEIAKKNLMVGHTYRYYPSSLKTKEIIDSGEIGKIKLVLGYGLDPGKIPGKDGPPEWTKNKESGGGVFFDAIHGVDLLRYLLNSEVESVYSPIIDSLHPSSNADELGFATINFKNGVVATIMPVAPTWGIRDTGFKIIGEKGALYVTYGEEIKVGKKEWKQYDFDYKSSPASIEHNLQGFVNQISEFVNSIIEKRQPIVSGEEGRKNLEIILAIYESFKNKKIEII